MKTEIFDKLAEVLEENGGYVVISDDDYRHEGTRVDVVKLNQCWDGGKRVDFYAGNPALDGTDQEEDWEQLDLLEDLENTIAESIVEFY